MRKLWIALPFLLLTARAEARCSNFLGEVNVTLVAGIAFASGWGGSAIGAAIFDAQAEKTGKNYSFSRAILVGGGVTTALSGLYFVLDRGECAVASLGTDNPLPAALLVSVATMGAGVLTTAVLYGLADPIEPPLNVGFAPLKDGGVLVLSGRF